MRTQQQQGDLQIHKVTLSTQQLIWRQVPSWPRHPAPLSLGWLEGATGGIGGCHLALCRFIFFQGHLLRDVGKTKKCASVEGVKLKKEKEKKKKHQG